MGADAARTPNASLRSIPRNKEPLFKSKAPADRSTGAATVTRMGADQAAVSVSDIELVRFFSHSQWRNLPPGSSNQWWRS